MQQGSEAILLACQSKVVQLTEEINELERAKSRLEWIAVGPKSYQKLKRYFWDSCCFVVIFLVISVLLIRSCFWCYVSVKVLSRFITWQSDQLPPKQTGFMTN